MSGPTEPLGMRKQCPSGTAIYGNAVNQSAGRRLADRQPSISPAIEGEGSMVQSGAAYGEADQSAHPPSCQCPPKPERAVFGSEEHAQRERDRWSSGGQSAAEGRGAKRWP